MSICVAPASEAWAKDEEVDSWEARGQSLWKSSDDEDDAGWNSYDEYHPDNDEGDFEGDETEEELVEITPPKRELVSRRSLPSFIVPDIVRRPTPSFLSSELRPSASYPSPPISICSSPSSVSSQMYCNTAPSTPNKAIQIALFDSPSKRSSCQSRNSMTDFDAVGSAQSPRFCASNLTSGPMSPSRGIESRSRLDAFASSSAAISCTSSSISCKPPTSLPASTLRTALFESPSKSLSRQSATDSDTNELLNSPRFYTPKASNLAASRVFTNFSSQPPTSPLSKRPPPPFAQPAWTDSDDEDSSDYSSSDDEERAPPFDIDELVAHLRELGYAVPETGQAVDLKDLLGKMDEYFQDLFKKQASQRKAVETEAETEIIVQEVQQWGKNKTLWMMLNDLSPPSERCNLSPDAAFDELTRQYRKVLLRIHPDKNAHKGWREQVRATEQFKWVSAAFFTHKKKLGM